VKKLTVRSENSSRKFCLFENLAAVAGDKVNVDIAPKVVQHLGGLCKEFVLYFPEIIKANLDLVKNRFVVPLDNVADYMKDELIDLRNKSGAKYVFEANKICDFWLKAGPQPTDTFGEEGGKMMSFVAAPNKYIRS